MFFHLAFPYFILSSTFSQFHKNLTIFFPSNALQHCKEFYTNLGFAVIRSSALRCITLQLLQEPAGCYIDLWLAIDLGEQVPAYLEEAVKQKPFPPHHRRISDLFIKVNCFHLDLHSLRHALFNGDLRLLDYQFLGQHTGQASLTATVWTPILRETRDYNMKLCLTI